MASQDISIKVNIGDRIYPLKIQAKEEEYVRKAAKLLNEKIDQVDSEIQQLHEFKAELEQYRDRWSERSLDRPDIPKLCSLIDEVTTPLPNADSAIATSSTTKRRFSWFDEVL